MRAEIFASTMLILWCCAISGSALALESRAPIFPRRSRKPPPALSFSAELYAGGGLGCSDEPLLLAGKTGDLGEHYLLR